MFYDNNVHDRGVKMLHIKKLKTFFRIKEAARPPPILKKETFLTGNHPFNLFREEKMNQPAKHQKQNFKTPPHFFESSRGPPE